ncbi:MAG: sugar phosphate isomerase/epimerase family protein [Terriglobia bacterium]
MRGTVSASRYQPILAAESYIWIQRFHARHETLADGVAEMCQGFRQAGFKRVELDSDFLAADLRAATLDEFKKNRLQLLSVYANSTMHTPTEAEQSIAEIVTLAQALAGTGFQAIVTDPSPRPDRQPKSATELSLQARSLNRLGEQLRKLGIRLMIHHHTPELADHARQWRYELAHTDPGLVLCVVDVDWAFRGGQNPLAFIKACGKRLACLHLRNDRNGVWMEDFGPGEIDYQPIAQYLRQMGYRGYLVVELAYEKKTKVSRPLVADLRRSRLYAEKVFAV